MLEQITETKEKTEFVPLTNNCIRHIESIHANSIRLTLLLGNEALEYRWLVETMSANIIKNLEDNQNLIKLLDTPAYHEGENGVKKRKTLLTDILSNIKVKDKKLIHEKWFGIIKAEDLASRHVVFTDGSLKKYFEEIKKLTKGAICIAGGEERDEGKLFIVATIHLAEDEE